MRVLAMAAAVTAVGATGMVAPATAGPNNDNTRTETVTCEPPLGTLTVTIVDPPSRFDREGDDEQGGAKTAFTPDGHVVVVKAEETTFHGTLTVEGEAPVPFSGAESDSWGAHGNGVAGRLVECGSSGTFSDSLVIEDGSVADELNALFPAPFDWADHIGDEVHITGEFTFTVQVHVPG